VARGADGEATLGAGLAAAAARAWGAGVAATPFGADAGFGADDGRRDEGTGAGVTATGRTGKASEVAGDAAGRLTEDPGVGVAATGRLGKTSEVAGDAAG